MRGSRPIDSSRSTRSAGCAGYVRFAPTGSPTPSWQLCAFPPWCSPRRWTTGTRVRRWAWPVRSSSALPDDSIVSGRRIRDVLLPRRAVAVRQPRRHLTRRAGRPTRLRGEAAIIGAFPRQRSSSWHATPGYPPMANAPPVTSILAKYVASHPGRGWTKAVDHEAHRTFYNWLGCAIGASHHEAAEAALAAIAMLEPAPQASILGCADKVDMASAALVNGITSHTFDYDDTHLKTIIHPAGPCGFGSTGARRAHRRKRSRTDRLARPRHRRRVPHGERALSGSLRPRLAHHGLDRHAGRCCGVCTPAATRRNEDRDGARHRRVAADRLARAVRHDDQAVPSGRLQHAPA